MSTDTPLVSIVIPFYNAATRAADMLASVAAQECREIEVIAVDDCSTDGTGDIVRGALAASRLPSVIITHDKNMGVSAARNSGLGASSGRYVCFADGDDLLAPEYASALASTASASGADIALCGYINRYEDGRPDRPSRALPRAEAASGEELAARFALGRLPCAVWSAAYSRSFLVGTGLRFEDGCGAGEDTEFLTKALCRAGRVALTAGQHYIYVHHAEMGSVRDNDTGEKRRRRYADNTEAHARTASYLAEHARTPALRRIATCLLEPQSHIRRLTALARERDRDGFRRMASLPNVRAALRRALSMAARKPEAALKALALLLFPDLYYKARSK